MDKMPCAVLLAAPLLAAGPATAVEPQPNWGDSYSVDGRCHCDSSFDHGADTLSVDTPQGPKNVREVCALIGPGPGAEGHPVYNDLQCGHGPPNFAPGDDERLCPGRVDLGEAGCEVRGPRWDLDALFPDPEAAAAPIVPEGSGPPAGIDAAEADLGLGDPDGPVAATLAFEAEAADVVDDAWVRVAPGEPGAYGPGGPDNADDPDAAHLERASGGSYLELLPDAQRAPGDPDPAAGAWLVAGAGPRLQYLVDFPSAGDWTVRARLYRTGGHDAALWVGIDGRFDAVEGLLNACATLGEWAWSGCDGAAGGRASLRVGSAGVHTVEIAGRDDGVEIDRIALSLAADTDGGPATDGQGVPDGEGVSDARAPAVSGPAGTDGASTLAGNGAGAGGPGAAVKVGAGVAPGVAAAGLGPLLAPLLALGCRLGARRRRRAAGGPTIAR